MKNILEVGTRKGRLTITGNRTVILGRGHYPAICDCGKEVTIRGTSRAKSCGCLKIDSAIANCKSRTKHGDACGSNPTPEYSIWRTMKARCSNVNNGRYYRYGKRGIKVCDEWASSFETFLKDVGRRPSEKHSIDRINNDGNYEPSNVRWATPLEQRHNQERYVQPDGNTSKRVLPLLKVI